MAFVFIHSRLIHLGFLQSVQFVARIGFVPPERKLLFLVLFNVSSVTFYHYITDSPSDSGVSPCYVKDNLAHSDAFEDRNGFRVGHSLQSQTINSEDLVT